MHVEELLRWLGSSGLGFEQVLILFLLGYIFKVQFEQQKQRIWATLEREQHVLMMEEIQRRVRQTEAMVEALCARLGTETGGIGDAGRGELGASAGWADPRRDGARAGSAGPAAQARRALRRLRAARAGGVDELAEVCEPTDVADDERGEC
jgi:hypothetical protein